jgi:hypothetical protein
MNIERLAIFIEDELGPQRISRRAHCRIFVAD